MEFDMVLLRPNDKKAIYGTLPDSSTASDPPYWLAMMGGYMRNKGISVRLIDAEGENQSPKDTAGIVVDINPKLVGILPLGSNLNTATWKMHGMGVLAKAIKKANPDIPVFMWGFHVSALPHRTLNEEAADFIVSGEGFETIEELLSTIKGGNNDYENIRGLWYKENGEVKGNGETRLINDLNALPYDGWDMLPAKTYRNHLHFALENLSKRDSYGAVLTSLGCPFSCSYCALKYFSGDKKVRYKSPKLVVEEMEYHINNFGTFYFRILDECFTLNRQHAMAVCDEIIDKKFDISIWAYARVDTLDKELIERMYKANIKWIALGIESGNKDIRDGVSKGQYDLNGIKDMVKLCNDTGISVCDNYMFGLPGDTLESMQETLDLAKEINCGYPNMYCTMAYPGSDLYTQAIKEGLDLPDSWLGYSQLSYETYPLPNKNLTAKQILEFRDFAFNDFFTNNEMYYNMIYNKFGQKAVDIIKETSKAVLRRRLLEN